MSKFNIIGLISLALGGIIIGFQAIGNLVKESYSWEAMSLLDLLKADQLRWIDSIPVEFIQNAILQVISAPLYLVLFIVAGICFVISVLFRL